MCVCTGGLSLWKIMILISDALSIISLSIYFAEKTENFQRNNHAFVCCFLYVTMRKEQGEETGQDGDCGGGLGGGVYHCSKLFMVRRS